MSRWIEVDVDNKQIKETIADKNGCRNLCNDVCCNEDSEHVGYFVLYDECKGCPLFEKEDGIITE